MLTQAEYEALWSLTTPSGFEMDLPVPGHMSYWGHVSRENKLEDYLDIFRGTNTRIHRGGENPENHPFFINEEPRLETKPRIRYIIIGEASPSWGANYFYDTREIANCSYLRECFNATYGTQPPPGEWVLPSSEDEKIAILLNLASRGVLFLDMFPFAYNDYSYIRADLINSNVVADFWRNGHNAYSVHTRLTQLMLSEIVETPQICLAMSPSVVHYIAHELANGHYIIPQGYTLQLVPNFFNPQGVASPVPIILPDLLIAWPPGALLNGQYANPGALNYAPFYRCCSYAPWYTTPAAIFITNAFI